MRPARRGPPEPGERHRDVVDGVLHDAEGLFGGDVRAELGRRLGGEADADRRERAHLLVQVDVEKSCDDLVGARADPSLEIVERNLARLRHVGRPDHDRPAEVLDQGMIG